MDVVRAVGVSDFVSMIGMWDGRNIYRASSSSGDMGP